LLVFEAEIERGDRPSQGRKQNRRRPGRGGDMWNIGQGKQLLGVWGRAGGLEAFRDTHAEIRKHGGCGLFLDSRRRQKERGRGKGDE
jgi:hypothetical protein